MPKKSKPRTNWKQRALLADERCAGYSERLAEIHGELDKALGRVRCCEEVLSVARKIEMRLEQRIIELAVDRGKCKARAESAEKHNALLLEEREAKAANRTVCSGCHLPYCHGECFTPVRFHGDKKLFEIGDVVETPEGTFTIGDPANPPKVHPKLTHWQRFKSWLSAWKVELLIVMLILGFLAGLVAFVYWPR